MAPKPPKNPQCPDAPIPLLGPEYLESCQPQYTLYTPTASDAPKQPLHPLMPPKCPLHPYTPTPLGAPMPPDAPNPLLAPSYLESLPAPNTPWQP